MLIEDVTNKSQYLYWLLFVLRQEHHPINSINFISRRFVKYNSDNILKMGLYFLIVYFAVESTVSEGYN